jgi:hypothetical protein
MQLFAAARGIGVVLLGGTFVSFLPEMEAPTRAERLGSERHTTAAERATSLPSRASSGSQALVKVRNPIESADAMDEFSSDERVDERLGEIGRRDLPETSEVASPPAIRLAAAGEVVTDKASKSKDHLTAKVFLSTDKLPAGGRCRFVVILDVQDGWHINANPASPENMIPTTVTVKAKHKSKQLETKYPKGAEFTLEELSEPLSVYEGQVQIRGEIEGASDAAGKTEELEFQIRYQACNDKNCLPPKTMKLSGKIDIVKPGTPVKQINQKYFSQN